MKEVNTNFLKKIDKQVIAEAFTEKDKMHKVRTSGDYDVIISMHEDGFRVVDSMGEYDVQKAEVKVYDIMVIDHKKMNVKWNLSHTVNVFQDYMGKVAGIAVDYKQKHYVESEGDKYISLLKNAEEGLNVIPINAYGNMNENGIYNCILVKNGKDAFFMNLQDDYYNAVSLSDDEYDRFNVPMVSCYAKVGSYMFALSSREQVEVLMSSFEDNKDMMKAYRMYQTLYKDFDDMNEEELEDMKIVCGKEFEHLYQPVFNDDKDCIKLRTPIGYNKNYFYYGYKDSYYLKMHDSTTSISSQMAFKHIGRVAKKDKYTLYIYMLYLNEGQQKLDSFKDIYKVIELEKGYVVMMDETDASKDMYYVKTKYGILKMYYVNDNNYQCMDKSEKQSQLILDTIALQKQYENKLNVMMKMTGKSKAELMKKGR